MISPGLKGSKSIQHLWSNADCCCSGVGDSSGSRMISGLPAFKLWILAFATASCDSSVWFAERSCSNSFNSTRSLVSSSSMLPTLSWRCAHSCSSAVLLAFRLLTRPCSACTCGPNTPHPAVSSAEPARVLASFRARRNVRSTMSYVSRTYPRNHPMLQPQTDGWVMEKTTFHRPGPPPPLGHLSQQGGEMMRNV